MADEIIKEIVINELESCIICKQQTEYKRKTHIENRGCYVKGVGQLCRPCYLACYNTSTTDDFQEVIFE